MTTGKDNRDHPESSDQPSPASDPSSDDEKLEHLATRFLALWREQVAATADGADAASAIGRLYASLGADTTRMGEGFEAWGKLIGQMAMGQQADPKSTHPFAGAMGAGASNPLMAMMDQMAKAARDLPSQPFGGVMPFPPGMAEMAGMSGMTAMKPGAATAPGSNDKAADHKTDTAEKADAGTGGATGTTGTTGNASPAAAAPPAAATPDDRPSPAKSRKKTTAAKNAAKGQGKNDQSTETKAASTKKTKPKAGGAKAASDAHGSRDDELAQLARRIADLSETIAALEAGTEGTGGKPPEGD
ncbi:hypothetical protein TH8_08970 [Thalassospira profundimaris]|nr:hypothetical protein TH8_08970 [Thalassospira profundimaris]